jgi:hypothetical protein
VFGGGPDGSWDELIAIPSVRVEGTQWELWYTGVLYTPPLVDPYSIGRAVSSDGIHWTRDQLNPLLVGGGAGSWNEDLVAGPVFYDAVDAIYRMYFHVLGSTWFQIALATSVDGETWSICPSPILSSEAEWESVLIAAPYVFRDADGFKMYYHGWGDTESGTVFGIGYATSADGIHWLKDPRNPVIRPLPGAWDGEEIYAPRLIESIPDEWLFYLGVSYTDVVVEGIGALVPGFRRVSAAFDGTFTDPREPPWVQLSANPFRHRVDLHVEAALPWRPSVYDVAGRRVADLVGSGATWSWDGRFRQGEIAPPGVYWLRVRTDAVGTAVKLVKVQ